MGHCVGRRVSRVRIPAAAHGHLVRQTRSSHLADPLASKDGLADDAGLRHAGWALRAGRTSRAGLTLGSGRTSRTGGSGVALGTLRPSRSRLPRQACWTHQACFSRLAPRSLRPRRPLLTRESGRARLPAVPLRSLWTSGTGLPFAPLRPRGPHRTDTPLITLGARSSGGTGCADGTARPLLVPRKPGLSPGAVLDLCGVDDPQGAGGRPDATGDRSAGRRDGRVCGTPCQCHSRRQANGQAARSAKASPSSHP
jgi:hypothetical protein